MSVDTLRETFHINRISNFYLQDFLTAQTYRPEITAAKKHILGLNNCTLQSVCTKLIQQGKSPKYSSEGLKCLKPRNTNTMLVSIDDIDWIDISTKEKIQNQKVSYGDILITRSGSGTIGRASIYPYKDDNVYVNDHLFIVRPDKADSHYVCSYLGSYFGQRLLEAGISGSTGQLNLSNQHIKSIRLFEPDINIQKYIGDKVRQAEQLQVWKKGLEIKSSELFKNYLNQYGFKILKSDSIIWTSLEDRLDPAYYNKKYHFFNAEWFQSNSEPLNNFITSGSYGVLPSSSSYGKGEARFIRATDLQNANVDISCFTKVPQEEVVDKARINEGDILLEIKGAISSCEIASSHLEGAYVNGSIYRFTPKGINSAYLTFYLNSEIKKLYCERVSVNNIISYLDLASIQALPVLRLPSEVEDLIGKCVSDINLAKKYVFKLLKSSKILVEALIEGQLTEEQLIQTQQALEDGDNTLDKAILSKLSSEGYAIEGATPLFSDIDELYRLLASATAADSED